MKEALIQHLLTKVAADYDFLANEFNRTRQFVWPELKTLAAYVKDGDQVLDLGCGNGRLLVVLTDKNINYLGLDNCSTLIQSAQAKWGGQNNVKFAKQSLLDLSNIATNSYDAVFLIAVLHHLPGRKLRRQVLQEVKRILKPGGHLLMTNWNFYQKKFRHYRYNLYYRLKNMPLSLVLNFREIYFPWQHPTRTIYRYCHVFSLKEIEALLCQADLALAENKLIHKGGVAHLNNGWNIVTAAVKEIKKV